MLFRLLLGRRIVGEKFQICFDVIEIAYFCFYSGKRRTIRTLLFKQSVIFSREFIKLWRFATEFIAILKNPVNNHQQ